jgi:hypothetical protein
VIKGECRRRLLFKSFGLGSKKDPLILKIQRLQRHVCVNAVEVGERSLKN